MHRRKLRHPGRRCPMCNGGLDSLGFLREPVPGQMRHDTWCLMNTDWDVEGVYCNCDGPRCPYPRCHDGYLIAGGRHRDKQRPLQPMSE